MTKSCFHNFLEISHKKPGFFVNMNSSHLYWKHFVGFKFLHNVLDTQLNEDLMSEFEDFSQGRGRVSIQYIRS